ncbi:MAG: hypothetical protein ACR2MT_13730 [Aurantibacter sp.]
MSISVKIMGYSTIKIGEVQELINLRANRQKLQTDESVKATDEIPKTYQVSKT